MRYTILISAMMFLPLCAMAMRPMSEADLSSITCRSGVSIMIDVTMNIQFGTIAWGDPDGYRSVQTSRKEDGDAASYVGASEPADYGLPGMPHIVRADPDTMILTPDGTEFYLHEDIFKHTVLSKP